MNRKTTKPEPEVIESDIEVIDLVEETIDMIPVQDYAEVPDDQPGKIFQVQPLVQSPQLMQADRMLELAITSNADMDKLERLLALKERYEKEEARKAFTAAMAAFKGEAVVIKKDKLVKFEHKNDPGETSYWHATLGNIISKAVPAMSKHGLSHRWVCTQGDQKINVECVITHAGGHSETTPPMSAGADGSGKKNPIQQIASTMTYLQRYTFLEATGLAVEDQDDDGRTGINNDPDPVAESISDHQANTIHAMIVDNDIDMDIFLGWLANSGARAGRISDIPLEFFDRVVAKVKTTIKAKAK